MHIFFAIHSDLIEGGGKKKKKGFILTSNSVFFPSFADYKHASLQQAKHQLTH